MSRPTPAPSPATAQLSATAFDLLQIELVPLAQRLHAAVPARNAALARGPLTGLFPAPRPRRSRADASAAVAEAGGAVGGLGVEGSAVAATTGTVGEDGDDEDDEGVKEAVFWRLDALGYRVGQGLVEGFSADQPRPTTDLDKIKFVCKDLWTRVFRKQIDNLKTNHRGTFVLTDARFAPLHRVSADRRLGPRGVDLALARAQPFLWFPCGVIRGALQGLGMDATVNAETTDLPVATFQIRVVGAKP